MQCSQADLTSTPRRDFPMSPFERLCLDFGSPPHVIVYLVINI